MRNRNSIQLMRIQFLVVAALLSLQQEPRRVNAWHSSGIPRRWLVQERRFAASPTRLDAAVGIVYGTSTGSTQTCADKIYEAFGPDLAAEPVDVDTLAGPEAVAALFAEHGALVVGTPTWNTGADTERSGTGWDELYYSTFPDFKAILEGKKVAVFGLGDQVSYSENYADATGELFDVFESMGCQMLGSWGTDGYEHEDSKSLRGDKFCGLLLDMVNQEELTDERIERWVSQLKDEGILEGGGGAAAAGTGAAVAATLVAEGVNGAAPEPVAASGRSAADWGATLDENSALLDQSIAAHSTGGFTPHFNPRTGRTMWTSPDGTKSFVTADAVTSRLSP
jgi:flavodoxin I